MLTYKRKRQTKQVYAHDDCFCNDVYIGYIIKNNSQAANEGENFNFGAFGAGPFNSCYAPTKKELKAKIFEQLLAIPELSKLYEKLEYQRIVSKYPAIEFRFLIGPDVLPETQIKMLKYIKENVTNGDYNKILRYALKNEQ